MPGIKEDFGGRITSLLVQLIVFTYQQEEVMSAIFFEIDTGKQRFETVNLANVIRIIDIGGGYTDFHFVDGSKQVAQTPYDEMKVKVQQATSK
ncbi:hypothetical protein GC174_15950 [bacterium]|nr:hypothetical protein [bacterium]